jgi:prepilin-type N-terminal cleavage/methylation domain-containing protein
MLKSKLKFPAKRQKVSAFPARHSLGDGGSLSTLRSRITAEDGQPSAFACSAFTLLEMLVVISILGLLAALTVPVLKNFGKADATLGASRQLLDGVARARQMAMSQRTTVYMVFVPTNFWVVGGTYPDATWWPSLSPAQQNAVTNLADRQLSGYTFIARGAIGDQPGKHLWHYLDAAWQGLPEGTFIAFQKFATASNNWYTITDPVDGNRSYRIYGFATNAIPFPAATNLSVSFPFVAFNYLGQLTLDGQTVAPRDEYIPLAHGSVMARADAFTKTYVLAGPPSVFNSPDVAELPPGNSTNISYNIVRIDRLTGRAGVEVHKMQ